MDNLEHIGRVAEADQMAAAMASSVAATEAVAGVVAAYYRQLRRGRVPPSVAMPLTAQFQALYWARVMYGAETVD